jgi:DNA invertase Pin-like site-specific DNA recombinase
MLRVAAYCRVSTVHDDQLNSLESQVLYFDNYIKKQDDWEHIGLYADEGLTGTSVKSRTQFNLMVEAALCGKVDLIITKDVSRFARNTVDLLSTTRKLTACGVGVFFINDNIDTRNSEGEMRLSIIAVFAQEESRKISERVKWGVARAAERGFVLGCGVYGYYLEKGVLTVNEDEAAVVRKVYHDFVSGRKGIPTMAKEMNRDKIPCGKLKKWTGKKITRMLRDNRYTGDLIQRKTHIENYLTHKSVASAKEEWIVVRDNHEAIIDKQTFEAAQTELNRRAALVGENSCHTNRYWASGLVKCGRCGSTAVSRTKYNKDGTHVRFWTCKNIFFQKRHSSGCDSNLINDAALLECVKTALQEVDCNRDGILREVKKRIKEIQTVAPPDAKHAVAKIDGLKKKIQRVIDLYVEETITKEELNRQKQTYNDEIEFWATEVARLQNENEIGLKSANDTMAIMSRIEAVITQKDPTPVMYSHVIEKIVLFNNYCVDVYFKYIDSPVRVRYKTSGRKSTYRVECRLREEEMFAITKV